MFFKGDTPWRLATVRRLSIWLAVVFVALTAVYLIVGRSALLDVEEIKVYGLHHLTLEEVQHNFGFQLGDSLLSVDK